MFFCVLLIDLQWVARNKISDAERRLISLVLRVIFGVMTTWLGVATGTPAGGSRPTTRVRDNIWVVGGLGRRLQIRLKRAEARAPMGKWGNYGDMRSKRCAVCGSGVRCVRGPRAGARGGPGHEGVAGDTRGRVFSPCISFPFGPMSAFSSH